MADNKKKNNNEKFFAKGILKYPRLNAPDYGTDNFPKEGGEYNTKVIISGAELERLQKKMDRIYDEAIAEGKEKFEKKAVAKRKKTPFAENPYFTPVYNEDEEETGDFEISVKTKASGVSKKTGKKWSRKVPLYDAKLNKLSPNVNVYGGTVAKVSFTVSPYFVDANHLAGLSLRLEGVQVLELVSGGEASASSLGFEEEDGFEYDGSADEDEDDVAEDEDDEEEDDINF